ncbi:MAG: GspH/FimT family pseudopilin [Gammaproteobacteria bacterium]|nr:GspH/FimT family pseudopilin [Gammaproteobacteria bacterium]
MNKVILREVARMAAANSKGRRRAGGFTIIELMVVLAIVAAVLVLVPPGMAQLALTTNLKSYSHEMLTSLHLTRSEAIKRNVPVTLCVSTDGTSCAGAGSWAQGWIILAPDGTVIRRQQAIPDGFRMTGSTGGAGDQPMVFQPSGTASTSSNITVCRQVPAVGNQERVVRLTATGRARVTTTRTGTCA